MSGALLIGCAHQREPLVQVADTPESWQSVGPSTYSAIPNNWLKTFNASYLAELAEESLHQNYALAQSKASLNIAAEQVVISGANRWPSLNLSLGGQRVRPTSGSGNIVEQVEIGANLSFELDIWGKLSDAQRQARLNYEAQKARHMDTERRLVAQTVGRTFDLISARQLSSLFEQRLANLAQGLDVIERGYRSGLNQALDVYLAQNTYEQERANVASQQQVSFQAATSLERLLARYPNASIRVPEDQLPALTPIQEVGVPADLLKRRLDVQQAWLELLASDAGLAVAHKNRFVSLDLSASLRDTDSAVSRLLDSGQLAFSVAASLFQPVFQGGRLRSLEEQARLAVQRAEKAYLDSVYNAMAEVEIELNRAVSLAERYDALQKAQENASTALTLAFDQYQRGLVNFTTVLESQRRAFDSQNQVLRLQNQRLQNRVALLLALGGNY